MPSKIQQDMIRFMKLPAFFFFVLFVMSLPFSGAYALDVNNVRFGVHPDKTRMVIELDDTVDFRVFMLTSPYRLVVDLPQFKWQAGVISKPSEPGIKNIRQGNIDGRFSRLVLDLAQPTLIKKAFMLPAQDGKPSRLVVDFYKASTTLFAQKKSDIHGTLNFNDPIYQQAAKHTPPPVPPPPANKQRTGKKPIIVIDPGHGGVDPGAIGINKVFEKNVTLAVSKALKNQLEASGKYTVKLTRNTDKYLKLYERVQIARKHNAALFISIHADSIPKRNVEGFSVYTLSEKASDAQTAKLATKENQADLIAGIDLSHEDEEVADILIDLAMRDTMNQSKFFANTLVSQTKANGIEMLERPHRYAGFAVLKAPDTPSVLVEVGFMSNKTEAYRLSGANYQNKIAASIKKGIDQYFIKMDSYEH